MVNFTNVLSDNRPIRYNMDVLSHGQIGGKCKLVILFQNFLTNALFLILY